MARQQSQTIWQWTLGNAPLRRRDSMAVEEPLEIRVDTRPISVTLRTPGHDDELAAGFLLSEGVLEEAGQIAEIVPYPRNPSGNVLTVFLAPEVRVDFARLTRHVFASSSCGLCGKATVASVHQQFPPVKNWWTVSATTLLRLPDCLRKQQKVFDRTGGLHAAALFDREGELLVAREDIGRHNAVDKVLGWAMLKNRLPLDTHILTVSGRASFEILQKALAARVSMVVSVSAPSSLAVEFARASGQTLVGFIRGRRMNIYSGKKRIQFPRRSSNSREPNSLD